MYNTTIKNTYGYFGKNPSTLKEGYIQQMYSQEGDESLFLDAPHKITRIINIKSKWKRRSISWWLKSLQKSFHSRSTARRRSAMQHALEARRIPIIEEHKDIVGGWLGKPKGALSLLGEVWENNKYDKTSEKSKHEFMIKEFEKVFRARVNCSWEKKRNATGSRGERGTYHRGIWRYCWRLDWQTKSVASGLLRVRLMQPNEPTLEKPILLMAWIILWVSSNLLICKEFLSAPTIYWKQRKKVCG